MRCNAWKQLNIQRLLTIKIFKYFHRLVCNFCNMYINQKEEVSFAFTVYHKTITTFSKKHMHAHKSVFYIRKTSGSKKKNRENLNI